MGHTNHMVCGSAHSMQNIYIEYFASLFCSFLKVSLVFQMVKNLPAMQKTWVLSLGQEDPLEKEMATHFRIIAWKIPWMEEPGRLQSMGLQRVRHD